MLPNTTQAHRRVKTRRPRSAVRRRRARSPARPRRATRGTTPAKKFSCPLTAASSARARVVVGSAYGSASVVSATAPLQVAALEHDRRLEHERAAAQHSVVERARDLVAADRLRQRGVVVLVVDVARASQAHGEPRSHHRRPSVPCSVIAPENLSDGFVLAPTRENATAWTQPRTAGESCERRAGTPRARCFRRAVAAEETPEALEGLSWAAWWLDDGDGVFAARERAYRLYRRRGDAAARGAHGHLAGRRPARLPGRVAGGERVAAARAPPARPARARARARLARLPRGLHRARGAATPRRRASWPPSPRGSGASCGVADLEMLGLALEGATLVACARVEEGMRCLDEATATALEGEAAIPISCAWTFCILVSACTATLDFERAFAWCDRIAEFAERYGSRYMLAFCRTEYGAVHLWRGRWREAEAMLEAAVEDFARSRPAWVGGPARRAGRAAAAPGQAGRRDARCSTARAPPRRPSCAAPASRSTAGGRGRRSTSLERLLRQLPHDRRLDRAPALELLVHARAARRRARRGGPPRSTRCAQVERVRRHRAAAGVRRPAPRACSRPPAAEHERARTLLEDAVDRFGGGAPFEAARARLALATSLAALGRAGAAEREATARSRPPGRARARSSTPAGRARILDVLDRGEPLAALTPREREVLRLLADGLTNRQIAERLVVSEHTVHRHVTNLLRKLGLPSRTAAAAHAARLGRARSRSGYGAAKMARSGDAGGLAAARTGPAE